LYIASDAEVVAGAEPEELDDEDDDEEADDGDASPSHCPCI